MKIVRFLLRGRLSCKHTGTYRQWYGTCTTMAVQPRKKEQAVEKPRSKHTGFLSQAKNSWLHHCLFLNNTDLKTVEDIRSTTSVYGPFKTQSLSKI